MVDILVVDDRDFVHRIIENYLEKEPDLNIIGFAHDGKAAIEQVEKLNPDIVLMDVEMPVMNGLAATEIIIKQYPNTKVLMLTVHDNDKHLSKALKLGAKGYWLKKTTAEALANAIRYVERGYFQLSPELVEKYLNQIVKEQSESSSNFELTKKIEFLYKKIGRIERDFKKASFKSDTSQEIEQTIGMAIEKEMSSIKDRDANLQFKVDRLGHRLDRLEQNFSLLFKVQLFGIVLLVITIVFTVINNIVLPQS
jgi:DNA-binding NarL/FixJ family response regulator